MRVYTLLLLLLLLTILEFALRLFDMFEKRRLVEFFFHVLRSHELEYERALVALGRTFFSAADVLNEADFAAKFENPESAQILRDFLERCKVTRETSAALWHSKHPPQKVRTYHNHFEDGSVEAVPYRRMATVQPHPEIDLALFKSANEGVVPPAALKPHPREPTSKKLPKFGSFPLDVLPPITTLDDEASPTTPFPPPLPSSSGRALDVPPTTPSTPKSKAPSSSRQSTLLEYQVRSPSRPPRPSVFGASGPPPAQVPLNETPEEEHGKFSLSLFFLLADVFLFTDARSHSPDDKGEGPSES